MEETARGVRALTKAEALVVALIPCVPAGFETYETPRIGAVEATYVPTQVGVDAPMGIEGTMMTTT